MKTGLAIKACDVDGKYARIILLIGIFHAFMEVFKKANAREEDMLSFLVAPFYKKNDNEATKKNISYFINFSIPLNQNMKLVLCLLRSFLPLYLR